MAYVRALNESEPVDALTDTLDTRDVPLEGYRLQPGEVVQILVQVTLLEATSPARQVPAATLASKLNATSSTLALTPTIRICGCAMEEEGR
jgi:hypothetical protein